MHYCRCIAKQGAIQSSSSEDTYLTLKMLLWFPLRYVLVRNVEIPVYTPEQFLDMMDSMDEEIE